MSSRTKPSFFAQRIRQWGVKAGCHALSLPVAASCVFPLVWMLSSSLKTQQTVFRDFRLIPTSPHLENYLAAWTKGHFGVYFLNSLLYTGAIVFGVVAFAALAAYAISRLPFRGSQTIYIILIATMLIPVPGAFIALYVLLTKLGLIDIGTGQLLPRLGYVLPQINGGLPLGIFILKTFFDKIPYELEESAKIDGCGTFGVFWHIMLPLARPALAVVVIFTTLSAWNEFLLAFLVFSRHELMPLQRGLLIFQGAHLTDYPLLMAGMVITVLPVVAMYLMMHRHLIRGIIAGALKA